MQRVLLFAALLSLLMISCNLLPGKTGNKEKAIAKVYDKYLYAEEFQGIFPAGISAADSLEMTNAYINNWVRQELLLKQAEDNLDESSRDFSKQIEQYRNSLIIYAYESELVKQKLDTVVPMTEIQDYYLQNQANFLLRENIVLASYVILEKNSPLAAKVRLLLLSNRPADKDKLQTLCLENGAEFRIDNENWISFSDLTRKIPLSVDDQEDFLKSNKFYVVNDSVSSYFVAIAAYKSKESVSPLNFEIGNIRTILLNKRKADLLSRMEDDLISDAVKRNKYEIFKK